MRPLSRLHPAVMVPAVIALWLVGSTIGSLLVIPPGEGNIIFAAIGWVVCLGAAIVHIAVIFRWRREKYAKENEGNTDVGAL